VSAATPINNATAADKMAFMVSYSLVGNCTDSVGGVG
jgi:hypothetical protein